MRCLFVAVTQHNLSFFCLIVYHFLEHALSRACCVSNACTLEKTWDKKIYITYSRKRMTVYIANVIILSITLFIREKNIMDFAIFRLFIRVSLFVIALIACIIYLIKKRKLIYSIFFDKEAIKKEYTGKNDIIFLRLANTILVIVAILLILYLKDFVLDMPYIINKQYSYAEGYVTEQSHGGADISSERRSVFLYDKVKDDEIEITVFSRYIDKNTYLKVQYLPHTKYGAIVEIK